MRRIDEPARQEFSQKLTGLDRLPFQESLPIGVTMAPRRARVQPASQRGDLRRLMAELKKAEGGHQEGAAVTHLASAVFVLTLDPTARRWSRADPSFGSRIPLSGCQGRHPQRPDSPALFRAC